MQSASIRALQSLFLVDLTELPAVPQLSLPGLFEHVQLLAILARRVELHGIAVLKVGFRPKYRFLACPRHSQPKQGGTPTLLSTALQHLDHVMEYIA